MNPRVEIGWQSAADGLRDAPTDNREEQLRDIHVLIGQESEDWAGARGSSATRADDRSPMRRSRRSRPGSRSSIRPRWSS